MRNFSHYTYIFLSETGKAIIEGVIKIHFRKDRKNLGRYTHRVAISNERIVKIEDGKVTSKWRDYKNKNKMKEMTVTIEEFYTDFKINKQDKNMIF